VAVLAIHLALLPANVGVLVALATPLFAGAVDLILVPLRALTVAIFLPLIAAEKTVDYSLRPRWAVKRRRSNGQNRQGHQNLLHGNLLRSFSRYDIGPKGYTRRPRIVPKGSAGYR
jgi:hypothetical protein